MTISAMQDEVLQDVLEERDRQDVEWGVQDHHPAYWLAILGKQVGQLGTAILNREWWTDKSAAMRHMRHEAVQVAAVAVAFVEAIDRGNLPATLVTAQPRDPRLRARALGRDDESLHAAAANPETTGRGVEDVPLPVSEPGDEGMCL